MKNQTILALFFSFISFTASAQSSISLETQAHSAGFMPGIRVDLPLAHQINIVTRLAYLSTDRRDWGLNDFEKRSGLGFGLGAEFSNAEITNFSLNVRADIWRLDTDWEYTDIICGIVPPCFEHPIKGSSSVTVLQPTIGFGYQIPIGSSFFLQPSLNLGYEINLYTKGRAVGEGTLLLGGIQLGYLF